METHTLITIIVLSIMVITVISGLIYHFAYKLKVGDTIIIEKPSDGSKDDFPTYSYGKITEIGKSRVFGNYIEIKGVEICRKSFPYDGYYIFSEGKLKYPTSRIFIKQTNQSLQQYLKSFNI